MKARGCLANLVYFVLLLVAFGLSTYFWFTYFVRGRSVQTPNLVGKQLTEARALTSDLGLVLVVDNTRDRNSQGVAKGAIVWQNRGEGSLVKRGTRIHVGQSLGPLVLQVPDLSGQSPRTALLRFSQRNLQLGNLTYVDIAGGRGIVAEDPPRGTVVAGQTQVSLLVSTPVEPAAFVMPDLIDHPITDVRYELERHGLRVANVKFESYPGIANGIIIRQFPLQGYRITEQNPITLVVSQEETTAGAPPQPVLQQQPAVPQQ